MLSMQRRVSLACCAMSIARKSVGICLVVLVSLAMLFLFVWQYLIDPRFVDESAFRIVVSGLARVTFGERCRAAYRITNQADAINNAKRLWKIRAENWIAAGYQQYYDLVFNSEAFRNPGEANRRTNKNGWAVAADDLAMEWGITFEFTQDPHRAASLSAHFSGCGRTLDVEDMFYAKQQE